MNNLFQAIFILSISIILSLSLTLRIDALDQGEEKDLESLLVRQSQDVISLNPRELFTLEYLPPEVLTMIWQKLPVIDKASFSGACKLFYNIAHADTSYLAMVYEFAEKVAKEIEEILVNSGDILIGYSLCGFSPSLIETAMFLRYGVGYTPLPYEPTLPPTIAIFPTLIFGMARLPIHMSRCGSFFLERKELISLSPNKEIVAARFVHAFINHAYPMVSIGLSVSKKNLFTSFFLIPSLTLSNICKSIEGDESLVERITHDQRPLPASSVSAAGAYALAAFAALSKGMVIKNITDYHLEKAGVDESTRFWGSWGVYGLSATLTFGFESDKLLEWGRRLINNPTSTLCASAQAATLMSIYWGAITVDPWMAAGILSLEIATETLSIQHHMRNYIIPATFRIFGFT